MALLAAAAPEAAAAAEASTAPQVEPLTAASIRSCVAELIPMEAASGISIIIIIIQTRAGMDIIILIILIIITRAYVGKKRCRRRSSEMARLCRRGRRRMLNLGLFFVILIIIFLRFAPLRRVDELPARMSL